MCLITSMSSLSLRGILEPGKLVRANYDDWYRNLRIVLMHEKLIDTIDKPPMEALDLSDAEATKVFQKYLDECLTTKCIILASMSSELQRKHQDMDPYEIGEHLKKMYNGQSRMARFQLSKASSLVANEKGWTLCS